MNFKTTATSLRDNGYKIIPIPKGSKRAVEKDWESTDATKADIRAWAAGRYKNGNIGILTEHTPLVDIDVYDDDMAAAMEKFVLAEIGEGCVRVGQAPKRGLLFRASKPFRKMQCVYDDGVREHRIEVLGAGQQFVAYGVHPDTGREYEWTSIDEPVACPAALLPELTPEQCELIFDKFEALAARKKWTKKRRSGHRELDDGDEFERYKPIVKISDERVLEVLEIIGNEDADYDTYLDVGMALHHQYKGTEDGLKLWHEWAEKSSKYSAEDLNRRWSSFGHGPDTKTFASLLYWAKEIERKQDARAFETSLRRVDGCSSTELLFGDVLQGLARSITNDLQQDTACKRIQDRAKELTEVRPRLEVVRKALVAAMPKVERSFDMPKWCVDWVFVKRYSQFFNVETGEVLSRQAFDLAHARFLLGDAKEKLHDGRASDVALGTFDMIQVYDYVYLPGAERIVYLGRSQYVNRFNLNSLPPEREPSSADDFEAINRMLKHIALLFPDKEEQETLLDWIAYNVQFPSEKITWGVVIQSVDGAGKSWFSQLFSAIMGHDNVRNVPGEALKESYTSWAEGRKMIVIEEIRLHGNNRFDVLDKLKPYVTNQSVSVRRMNTDLYETVNVANYFMFTNYVDAMPLGANDRRYYVLMASFQTLKQMKTFNAENPDYFTDLFNILDFNPDVLRYWFNTRQIRDSFLAKGHAPHTEAKDVMRSAAGGEETEADDEALEEALTRGEPGINDALLDSDALRQDIAFSTMPPRLYGAMLQKAGFVKLGKFRIDPKSPKPTTLYTRSFELFADKPRHRWLEVIREML